MNHECVLFYSSKCLSCLCVFSGTPIRCISAAECKV
uniref:Uncharacterized protein n=1 Tax=Arundo donax TaxID=35708 RepID=A0A0A9F9Q1_ARUDO